MKLTKLLFLIIFFYFIFIVSLNGQPVVTNIPVGNGPCALLFNWSSNKLYCANYWSNDITVINGINNQILRTIPVGIGPCRFFFALNDAKIYCANLGSDDITIINSITDSIITNIQVGAGPCVFTYNSTNNKIYLANCGNNEITIIDETNDSIIRTLVVGNYPCALTFNQSTNKIYCANKHSNTVTVINGATDSIIATISVGNGPCAFVCYNNIICTANKYSNNLSIIDGQIDSVITTIQVGNSPSALTYEGLGYILCAHMALDSIYVINSQNYQIVGRIRSGTASNSFTEGGICCTNSGSDDITIIVPHYYWWRWYWFNFGVGRHPVAAVYGNYGKLYVANFWSDSISAIFFPPGIEEQLTPSASLHLFEIYPNPAKSYFAIRLPQSADRSQIKIFDVSGKIVKEVRSEEQETRISLDGIKNGVYFVRVGNEMATKKLVITK